MRHIRSPQWFMKPPPVNQLTIDKKKLTIDRIMFVTLKKKIHLFIVYMQITPTDDQKSTNLEVACVGYGS